MLLRHCRLGAAPSRSCEPQRVIARRLTRSDPEARRLRDETNEAIKERMAAANRLGDYREQVAAQVEQDLDELLEALRG